MSKVLRGVLKGVCHLNTLRIMLLLCMGCFCLDVFAAGTEQLTLSGIQKNITTGVGDLATIIMDVATITGAAFVFGAFFKFHQHKLNPTQVPLSNGVTLLLVGAGLCVFPHLIGTGTQAIFGTGVSKAGSSDIKTIVAKSGS